MYSGIYDVSYDTYILHILLLNSYRIIIFLHERSDLHDPILVLNKLNIIIIIIYIYI